jgi:hypothetical protein
MCINYFSKACNISPARFIPRDDNIYLVKSNLSSIVTESLKRTTNCREHIVCLLLRLEIVIALCSRQFCKSGGLKDMTSFFPTFPA